MFSTICFIIAMLAFACCLFMAVGAVLAEGLRANPTRKRPLDHTLSINAVAYVLKLV